MSGGHFDYKQMHFEDIASEIETLIKHNEVSNEYDYCRNYTIETLKEFSKAIYHIRKAGIYAQRIDWLICGDDSERSFHERLNEELSNIEYYDQCSKIDKR